MASRRENLAKLACAYSGLGWGLFWIPLRAMDEAGVTGAWATVLIYLVPLVIVLPLVLWWRGAVSQTGRTAHLIGIFAALGLVLYANAVIYTEVVRAMLLYYLTPFWSFLMARAVLGDPITPVRWLSMALGFAGMAIILGLDGGFPLPRNMGDWMGLAGGIGWAVAALLLRIDGRQSTSVDCIAPYYIWGTLIAVAIAVVPFADPSPIPDAAVVYGILPLLMVALALIIVPATLAAFWGSPLLNPGTVGLLFMTEISAGTLTAVLWADEPFGLREVAGIVLITAGGLSESVHDWLRQPSAA